MPNIREIARQAGVSRSTVSLVINGSALVKEETRQKVMQVIHESKYVPNNNARNLSRKVMSSLGIIVLSDQQRSSSYDFGNGVGLYSLNVIRGISDALADSDYSVIIEYFCASEEEGAMPKLIRNRRIDGAFIVGGFCEEQFISALRETGIPFVTVAVGAQEEACDSVISDPAQGAYLCLRYLMDRGHENIGFLNCPASFRSAHLRVDGVKKALAESGLPYDESSMLHSEHNNGESGYHAMRMAWERGARFDAIAAANPQIVMGAVRFLMEQGLRVPQDVSVIAYEDNSLCGYASPAMTAVNIQKENMGKAAVSLLLARIADPEKEIESVTIESYLVERDSVRTVARGKA